MADDNAQPCSHPVCSACTCARMFTTEETIGSREELMVVIALALCAGIGETVVSMLRGSSLILCPEHAQDVADITRRLGLPPEVQIVQVPAPGTPPS